jgi:hypothetical protein
MKSAAGTTLVAVLLMSGVPARAHHGTGTYDSTKSVTLSGVVTEFSFVNPHAALFFDVKDASGQVVSWAIEMNSPGVLRRAGWTKATFKAGDQITITVRPAKAGTPVGLINRSQPVLVNGTQVLSGDRTANAID